MPTYFKPFGERHVKRWRLSGNGGLTGNPTGAGIVGGANALDVCDGRDRCTEPYVAVDVD
jgi:hypothetical protein